MSTVWLVVLLVGAATICLKAAGPVFLGGRELPTSVSQIIVLLAPALFAALVVTQVVGGERRIEVDERVLGVVAAGLAIALRAPLIVVMAAAAAVTAGARALG